MSHQSDEVRIAEAVASLTARLEEWGVESAREKAHGWINDLLHAGWRPRALAVENPPLRGPIHPPPPEYLKVRDQLRTPPPPTEETT